MNRLTSKQYKFMKNLKFMNVGCKYLIKITKRPRFQNLLLFLPLGAGGNAPKGFKDTPYKVRFFLLAKYGMWHYF